MAEEPIRDKYTGKEAFNLFNIKGEGPAGSVMANDIDYIKGKKVHVEAEFRAYNSYEESFADYASLLTEAQRYAPALAVRMIQSRLPGSSSARAMQLIPITQTSSSRLCSVTWE